MATYTVNLTGAIDIDYAYVELNGTAYDEENLLGTYTFESKPTIEVYVSSSRSSLRSSCKVTLNGTTVKSGYGWYTADIGDDDVVNIQFNAVKSGSYTYYTCDITTTTSSGNGSGGDSGGGSTALPSGYVQLEYIQSSGTQCIDTGFIPNQDTRVDVVAEALSTADASFIPYGTAVAYNSRAFECYATGGQFEFNYNNSYDFLGTVVVGEKVTISQNKNNVTLNAGGETLTLSFSYGTFTAPYTLTLFAINRASRIYGTAKIYSCRVYDNGTLVRDFIPCKNASGAVGLWDDVNSEFYVNAGSGTFTAGPEVGGGSGDSTITPAGDHNTNIGQVAREIERGTVLIGGVGQEIESGLALVGGAAREIVLALKTFSVSISVSGTIGDSASVIISETTYRSNITVEVDEGTEITLSAKGDSPYRGSIYVNGSRVANATNASHTLVVASDIRVSLSRDIVAGWAAQGRVDAYTD